MILTRMAYYLAIQMSNLQTYKAPLESNAQGTRLFTSAASNQRG